MHSFKYSVLDKVSLHRYVQKIWYISFTIFFISLLFLFLPWQQTVKGNGVINAYDPSQRPFAISATIDGFIDEFHVEENQFVKKGDLLFTMVDLDKKYSSKLKNIEDKTKEQVQNIKQKIVLSKERKENLKEYMKVGLDIYVQKLSQMQDKIKSLKLKQISLSKTYDIEKSNFQRIKLLYKDGIESKRKYDTMENIYIKSNANLEKISIDILVAMKNIDIIKKEKENFYNDTKNKIKSLEENIISSKNTMTTFDRDLQRQSMNISRYDKSQVYAQKDGYVVRLFVSDKNKLINKGDKVIYFAPKVTQRALLLKVSDFNMPLIKEGLPVRLMFYGWPAMQISGWPTIKFGTFGGIVKKIDSISYDKGYFYAYVVEDPNEPWPNGNILKIGTQTTAWVRLETVSIWYQLWRSINAQPPKMISVKKDEDL